MPVYLVRTIKEHDLVGIFVAPNVDHLAVILDEGIDPGHCEYQRMGAGGIMWTAPAVTVPINLSEDDDAPDPIPWCEASLTGGWGDSLFGFAKGEWRRLYADTTGGRFPG